MIFSPTKPWQETSKRLAELLDASYKAHKDAEPKRPYLGGSAVGRDCEREIAYSYHGAPIDSDGFSGQLYRIFDRGHKGEDRVAEYLRVAGFNLQTAREDGKQFGFSALDGRFRGHIDGVIYPVSPLGNSDYMLWENKIVNSATFGKFWNHGVKKTKPVYYVQVNLYMAYMDLPRTLFTAENADNCEVFAEIIEFDARTAQDASDRAVRIVQSNAPEELPRVASAPDDYRCKMCDYRVTCWKHRENEEAYRLSETPPWLLTKTIDS